MTAQGNGRRKRCACLKRPLFCTMSHRTPLETREKADDIGQCALTSANEKKACRLLFADGKPS